MIRSHRIEDQDNGGPWQKLLTETLDLEVPFSGELYHEYTFRVRARDLVGHVSDWITTTVAIVNQTKYYFLEGRRVAMRKGDKVFYLYGDHLGSTSLATNESGEVVYKAGYLPYGGERLSEGVSPTDFGFTDQRNEVGLGLIDYNARYYDPFLGRFISPDTIVPEPSGLNRYRYAQNNPLKYTDPSGHFECEGAYDCRNNFGRVSKSGIPLSGSINDGVDNIYTASSVVGLDLGAMKYLGPMRSVGLAMNSNDTQVQGLSILSALFESGGVTAMLFGSGEDLLAPRYDVLSEPSLSSQDAQAYNKKVGGILVIGGAILEYTAMQRQLNLLEGQGANPVIIAKMRYEAQISTLLKVGEAHPLTFFAAGFTQVVEGTARVVGFDPPMNTYSQILTVSDFQVNPATQGVVEEAIRNEPVLRDVAEELRKVCTTVGGNC